MIGKAARPSSQPPSPVPDSPPNSPVPPFWTSTVQFILHCYGSMFYPGPYKSRRREERWSLAVQLLYEWVQIAKMSSPNHWALLGPGILCSQCVVFFASWRYSSPSTPKKRSDPHGAVIHARGYSRWVSEGMCKPWARGVESRRDSGGSGWFRAAWPSVQTQALRELQLLPRNRCCCFFPVWSTFVWACNIPAVFMADSLAV